jgi:D-sedoheptulose 7-phosphate isomerase
METDNATQGKARSMLESAFGRHKSAFEDTFASSLSGVLEAAEMLADAAKNGKTLLVCGNGGSAADSAHFAAEWVGRYKEDRRAMPAIALGSSISSITSIGNDYGFENIFAREVEAYGKQGDVLVAITTSGSSKNVLAAMKAAKQRSLKVILMTGKRGIETAKDADCSVVVDSLETARIQEVHEFVYHFWCEYVDAAVLGDLHK